MAHILGLRIKNFKNLRDVTLGQLSETRNDKNIKPLSPLTIIIGRNGTGKSVLLDVFGFLADCLKSDIREACAKRGGYDRIFSQGQKGNMEFEIFYKEDKKNARPLTYYLEVTIDKNGRPYATQESLSQEKQNNEQKIFLKLENGKGRAWSLTKDKEKNEKRKAFIDAFNIYLTKQRSEGRVNDHSKESIDSVIDDFFKQQETYLADMSRDDMESVELANDSELGLSKLGALKANPRLNSFREFMEGWYLSYFTPDAVRNSAISGAQQRLNKHGSNLANLIQFMQDNEPNNLEEILKQVARKIPGIDKVYAQASPETGELLLCFNDKGFKNPFFAQQMSDGTLKLIAYFLMLETPNPPPLMCIEEPENGLYHDILPKLVSEFRKHAYKEKGSSQIFMTTHQPYLVDAANPDEVWVIKKQEKGFSTIERASDNARIMSLLKEGDTLGDLWFSNYLD